MVMQGNLHHSLDRDPIFRALSSFYGITTADGLAGGTTLVCSILIGSNDFITDKAILLQSGLASFEDAGSIGFDPATGTITINPAFSSQVRAGTPFYVLNTISPALAALIMVVAGGGIRPNVSFYEGWQDEAGIDLTAWAITNPATGAPWTRGAFGESLMATSAPNLGENARLRSLTRWIASPDNYLASKIIRRFTLEFEAIFGGVANFDNANFFLGLTPLVGDTRANMNILGWTLVGAGNALQTLGDAGGAERAFTGFGENLVLSNKFKIEVFRFAAPAVGYSRWYLNDVLVATHVDNNPSNMPMYLNFYAPTAGGAATIRLGIVRAWAEDIAYI